MISQTQKLKANQDLEYYTYLLSDQMKTLNLQREAERKLIKELIKLKTPDIIENSLTPAQQRLLRVYLMRPNVLSQEEKNEAANFQKDLARIRSGGCFNMSLEKEKALRDKNLLISVTLGDYIPYKLCVDLVNDVLVKGLVNDSFGLVDIMISFPKTNEFYRYPLTKDEAEEVLGAIYIAGYDTNDYPRMRFKDIEDTQMHISLNKSLLQ